MKDYPSKIRLKDLSRQLSNIQDQVELPGVGWVPARPMGYAALRSRFRLAWMVFKGEADALVWPETEYFQTADTAEGGVG